MNFVEAGRVFVIGFCAFLAFVLLSLLLRNRRHVPQYTLAEAHQVVESSRTNALILLAAIPAGDGIVWLFSDHSGPLSTFVIILCVGDGLCVLNVLYELRKMHIAKKTRTAFFSGRRYFVRFVNAQRWVLICQVLQSSWYGQRYAGRWSTVA